MSLKSTIYELQQVTDFISFERMCCSLMFKYGYGELQPLGGYKDKGRDAIHYSFEKNRNSVFSFSVRVDWEKKIFEDANKIKIYGHLCDEMVYVTNQEISNSDIDRVRSLIFAQFGFKIRISGLTTTSEMIEGYPQIRTMYPEIFFLDFGDEPQEDPFDTHSYINNLKSAFGEWETRYTTLFASNYDFELNFTDKRGNIFDSIPATRIVETVSRRGKSVNVLLGESGAGKTTTLWKLVISYANAYHDSDSLLPILIPLRNWEGSIESLIFDQFSSGKRHIAALIARGKALLLFDALNEIPASQDLRLEAQAQIRSFTEKYPLARCLFTCRTSDYEEFNIDSGKGDPIREYHTNRLLPVQIRDYTRKVLGDGLCSEFLEQIDILGKLTPDDTRSVSKLISIPFFLRLLTESYSTNRTLPKNTTVLVYSLFFSNSRKSVGIREPSIDSYRRLDILSRLACNGFKHNAYISISIRVARQSIDQTIHNLQENGIVSKKISSDNIWKDFLSENYLVCARDKESDLSRNSSGTVEWVHQLLLDYCTAVSIIDNFLYETKDDSQVLIKSMLLSRYLLINPALMALDMVEELPQKRILFDKLRKVRFGFGEEMIKIIGLTRRSEFLMDGLRSYLNEEIITYDGLKDAAFYGYVPGVAKFITDIFKSSNRSHKVIIAQVLSDFVINNHNKKSQEVQESVAYVTRMAIGWMGNQNDGVRFHAAKILWENDRGLAGTTIESLARTSNDPVIRSEAGKLLEEWQPE